MIISSYLVYKKVPGEVLAAKARNCSLKGNSNSSQTITFTFKSILLGRCGPPYPPSYGLDSITALLLSCIGGESDFTYS